MNETNWLPGIIVGVGGIVLAVLLLLVTRKKGPALGADIRRQDLEQKVAMLLEQLRSLDADRNLLKEEAYQAEKTRLELAAAGAMRERDEYARAHPVAAPAAAGAPLVPGAAARAEAAAAPGQQSFLDRNPQLKGALWGAGIVLFVVAIYAMLNQYQTQRAEGGAMTGATPPNDMAQQEQQRLEDDPMFKQAWDRARANPADTETSAFVAHELIRLQRFDEADELTKKALAADPFHVETRIHKEVLKATSGNFKEAIEELGKLAKTYPDSGEALLFRGALAMEMGDSRTALESFERYQNVAPPNEQPPQLQQTIVMLRDRVK